MKTNTIGSIAGAELIPNVIVVGTGEALIRDIATTHGDGVYKLTDGRRSWQNLGLEKTHHLSKIRIHPRNPDLST